MRGQYSITKTGNFCRIYFGRIGKIVLELTRAISSQHVSLHNLSIFVLLTYHLVEPDYGEREAFALANTRATCIRMSHLGRVKNDGHPAVYYN